LVFNIDLSAMRLRAFGGSSRIVDVRFGSFADMHRPDTVARIGPGSGRNSYGRGGQLRANFGLMHRSKQQH